MKIAIVTGASGFIGRHLCELLSDNDVKTYIILRSKDSYKDELKRLSNCMLPSLIISPCAARFMRWGA